jgi:hypothetical protein
MVMMMMVDADDRLLLPAASMCADDLLKVNFGQEPFAFDVKTFILKKREGRLQDIVSEVLVYYNRTDE